CRRGLEQHGRLARGYLARVQPLYRALAGAPPDALRGRHLGRIAAGFVPIVALHLVVLPRDQAAPDAMARGWIAREKPQGVAVNEARLLGGYARALRVGEAPVDREAGALAGLGELDRALHGQPPRVPQVQI